MILEDIPKAYQQAEEHGNLTRTLLFSLSTPHAGTTTNFGSILHIHHLRSQSQL
jgi:hypothetical protein